MTELPDALKPWARYLEEMPLELALALSPWLRRLDTAIGPIRSVGRARTGAVDGYEGISRHGSFERLLLSDWQLADEVPDEFLRRASERELGFLQLAFQTPKGSLLSLALFDAGPHQLGPSRLVHVALLIVLARRAASAGAEFGWGVLQDPIGGLHGDVDADAVRDLLDARTADLAASVHLAQWQEILEEHDRDEATETLELWRVGSTATPSRFGVACARIDIDEVDGVEESAVRLTVDDGRAIHAALELRLPPRAESVRLLRDPYRHLVVAPRITTLSAQPRACFFCAGARRLIEHDGEGGVRAHFIPNSPKQGRRRPLLVPWRKDHIIVGAQFAKSGLFVLSTHGGKLHLLARIRAHSIETSYDLPACWTEPEPDAPIKPAWHKRFRPEIYLFFTDGANTFYRLRSNWASKQPMPVLNKVVAGLQRGGVLRMYALEGRQLAEYSESTDSKGEAFSLAAVFRLPSSFDAARHDGRIWVASHSSSVRSALLVKSGPSDLYFYDDGGRRWGVMPQAVEIADGVEPFGLLPAPATREYLCVALEPDRRTISAVKLPTGGRMHLTRASADVTSIWCAPTHARIGYATDAGEVVVMETLPPAVVARFAATELR